MREAQGRKRKRRTSHVPIPAKDRARQRGQVGPELTDWRANSRIPALRELARRLTGLKWNGALFSLLLEELYIDDLFIDIVGKPEDIPPARYPQAAAMAIVLRHSWREDDLAETEARLGVGGDDRPPRARRG
jgi:hypothetical protein